MAVNREDDGDDLIASTVERVRRWLAEAEFDERRLERRTAEQLHRLTGDTASLGFVMAFLDRVVRPESTSVAADALHRLAADGVPPFVSGIDRVALRVGAMLAPRLPGLVMPLARRRMRSIVGDLVVPADDPGLAASLANLEVEGFDVNVNLLGEAVLGDDEAGRRRDRILALVGRPDVRCVSVKASAVSAQPHVWDYEGTIARICKQLRPILSAAARTSPPTLVNLDMEEYRDLRITIDAYRRLLDEPDLTGLHAGIALQAYLPDSAPALDELTVWAARRRRAGGAPARVRIVKGANLAMERVDAAMHGWAQAPFATKAEVDANYKRMVDAALRPERIDAVHVGVASHNLFDVAWALELAQARGVSDRVTVEMLQGMAPALARAVRRDAGRLLVYAPVVADEDFDAALAYLFRRLEENAGGENFLRSALDLGTSSTVFERERSRFEDAVRSRDAIDVASRRHRSRGLGSGPFANAADTDPTDEVERSRILRSVSSFVPPELPPLSDIAAVDAVVSAAISSFWGNRTPADRAQVLRRVGEELEERRASLIAVMAHEAAKTVSEGDLEVSEAVDFAMYYAERALDLASVSGSRFEPLGVVVVVPPWNFPLAIPLGGVLAALVAGNSVILKPAPETPSTALAAAEACWAAGVPADALQYVRCEDGPVGEALIGHQRVGAIVLTGSTETAALFRRIAPRTPLFAETSGKNAIVVMPDADLDLAAGDIVRSAFGHTGQKCSAASLAILVGDVAGSRRFRRQLADATRSLAVGSALDASSVVGPLIGPPNDKLRRALTRLDPGESWLVQPRCLDESLNLWLPGIRDGVRPGSWFHRTECFGPVLGLIAVDDLDEAIDVQNATAFGLTGGIHSLNDAHVARWSERVRVGNAYVNRGVTGAIVQRQPFGGWKSSVVGPGAKAGGPNYVTQLVRWHDDGDYEGPSDADWWRSHFGLEHDPSALFCESNVFRYRPIVPFPVRVADGVDESSVERVLAAIAAVGSRADVSRFSDESTAVFWKRVAVEQPPRVRLLGVEDVPADLPVTVFVDDRPVVANGRIEMSRYLHEQAISTTLHRYGNLVHS